jgi:hypothetical protein
LDKLAVTNKMPIAKALCQLDHSFKLHLIKLLSTNEHCKTAAQLVKDFKFEINEFPDLKERLLKATMRYYLGCFLYKKPGHPDHMPLDRVEDLMWGFPQMLAYLVDDLAYKGKKYEAKAICTRH